MIDRNQAISPNPVLSILESLVDKHFPNLSTSLHCLQVCGHPYEIEFYILANPIAHWWFWSWRIGYWCYQLAYCCLRFAMYDNNTFEDVHNCAITYDNKNRTLVISFMIVDANEDEPTLQNLKTPKKSRALQQTIFHTSNASPMSNINGLSKSKIISTWNWAECCTDR